MSSPAPTEGAIRLIVCEDDPRFRRHLLRLLRHAQGIELAGEAATGEQACQLLAGGAEAEVLLLDLELPGMGGVDVVRTLRRAASAVEILILTTFRDETKVFEAIRAGAAGYLVKGGSIDALTGAIREVAAGGTVIEPRLARRFWNCFAAARGRSGEDFGLSEQEREVLAIVGRGLSNPEAAAVLGASRRSVKAHLARIYRKLGVSSRVEATVKALEAGVIEL